MTPSQFADFFASRVFERNDFGSTDALVAAIEKADRMEEWSCSGSPRQLALAKVAEKAPLRSDSPYAIELAQFPKMLQSELKAFSSFLDGGASVPAQSIGA